MREQEVEGLVRPVVEAAGLELWEVTFRRESGRRILRVVVDREGGIDLDTISDISERVSRRLDLEDVGGGPYSLEVSSPGLERALHAPEQFRRTVGQRVRVRTAEPVDGRRTHEGVLEAVDPDGIMVIGEGGPMRLGYDAISSARTVFEWGDARSRT